MVNLVNNDYPGGGGEGDPAAGPLVPVQYPQGDCTGYPARRANATGKPTARTRVENPQEGPDPQTRKLLKVKIFSDQAQNFFP